MPELFQKSKIKKSLLAEMTTFGVDDWLFIINIEVALFLVMMLRIRVWVFVALFMHFVLMLVTKLAPRVLGCYWKHMWQSDRYFSGNSPLQKHGKTPVLKIGIAP